MMYKQQPTNNTSTAAEKKRITSAINFTNTQMVAKKPSGSHNTRFNLQNRAIKKDESNI